MVYLCAINDVTVPILKVHLETTYLVGIDEPKALSFIIAIAHDVGNIASISTANPLNCDNLRKLWHEVEHYWQDRDMAMTRSAFSN